MKVLIKVPDSRLTPKYHHASDAGADVVSPIAVTIPPKKSVVIDTLVAFKIPKNTFLAVVSRSGLAAKANVTVLNGIGVIDQNFSGSIKVILHNHGNKPHKVEVLDRIAQVILMPYKKMKFKRVKNLATTGRGKNGLGSTGK